MALSNKLGSRGQDIAGNEVDNKKDFQFQLNNLPKKTFGITAVVPWSFVETVENDVLEKEGSKIEIKGFRKGMAPKNLVKEFLGKEKLIRLALEQILPDCYQKGVANFNLKPIVSPKVELTSVKENEDWQIKFTACEEPLFVLGDYKQQIKVQIALPAKIWTPDKKNEEKDPNDNSKEKKINAVIEWLIKNIRVEISELLIEEEVNRKLSELLEQTQKLGLTIEQYLSSTKKSAETLRSEYSKQASEALKFEFILGKIADEESIRVSEEDLQKAVSEAKNPEEKKALEEQKYYLAALLRRQKTLDFLADL